MSRIARNHPLRRLGAAVLAVLLAWAGALPGAAAQEDVRAMVAGPGRLDAQRIDALFDAAILESTSIEPAVDALAVLAADQGEANAIRAKAHLAIAHLQWRYGRFGEARSSVDAALALQETADGLLLKARLLDAKGEAQAALPWYERAAAATQRPEEQEFIRLRRTMIQVDERNVDALVDLARQRDQGFRNRAAVALALLGHPAKAIELHRPDAGAERQFQQHVRLAEWAIAVGDLQRAQREAWVAYRGARVRSDVLYALAVLVEAYRKADALPRLIEELGQRAQANEDLLRLRVDLLIETERYDQAIAFYQADEGAEVDAESRRRLIDLYDAAGRTEDMIAEYRRLIASEPDQLHWYAGLASHYMNAAQPALALEVWQALEAGNPNLGALLTAAGEVMIQMGFVDEAMQMIERHMAAQGESVDGLMFLFETGFARGRDEQALAVLERLEALLPPGAGDLRVVADAYERLHRPERALAIYRGIRETEGELGYDERLRLAWLHSLVGDKRQALEAWQAIWVSEDSPARRSFAESQLLLLAAELNALADIVVELEEKLVRREANRNDINLLVRIYTEVDDPLSATEVIGEYAKYSAIDEIQRLRQLAAVYRTLSDYSAYDQVLRQLEQIDRAHRVEHIQNLILNMLAHDLAEQSNERFAEIQRWLAELRAIDEQAVTGEFEASILSMGGFGEQAIESYRRALVEQPQNSDNLLLMADLMQGAGRRDEAVSLLQYVAEHAGDDNEFVVAVDGIINMIGQRAFGQELAPELRSIFRWTQRIVLERIAGRDDKFYLYTLLSEIAQETDDREGEFLAIENSLSQAGIRRPAILRELVTMATPDQGFFGLGQNRGAGDLERQLTYGRRLIGLGQQLPPEVYISLGETLLEQDDLPGAEKAFDMISDITGLVDVDQTKAEQFYAAGHPERALTYYNRALSVRRDELNLQLRTALLREVTGRDEVANRLYAQALENLLRSQPFRIKNEAPKQSQSPFDYFRPAVDTSVTRDYRAHYEGLVQGLLVTWPLDSTAAEERLAALRRMFDAELQNAADSFAAEGQLPLARYSRLDHIAQFLRRVSQGIGAPSLAEYADAGLRRHFPEDEALAEAPTLQEAEASDSPLRAQLQQAKDQGDLEGAVRLIRALQDGSGLEDLFRARIEAGSYQEGLGYARASLDAAGFRRFVSALAPKLKENPAAFATLLVEDPDLALDIEAVIGGQLISLQELRELLADEEVQTYLQRSFGGLTELWRYIQPKAGISEQIAFLNDAAGRLKKGQPGGGGFDLRIMIRKMFAKPLSADDRRALREAAMASFNSLDFKNEFQIGSAFSFLMAFDVHPENQGLLHDLADFVEAQVQGGTSVKPVLEAFFAGRADDAFAQLLELEAGGRFGPGGLRFSLGDAFADSRAKMIAALQGGKQLAPAAARTLYEMEFPIWRMLGGASPAENRRLAELLEQLIALYPQDARYRQELAATRLGLGDRVATERALRGCYEFDPSDEFLRAAYYLHLLAEQKHRLALAVAKDGGPDLSVAETLTALAEKAGAERQGGPASSSSIFLRIHAGAGSSDLPWSLRRVGQDVERLRGRLANSGSEAQQTNEAGGGDEPARQALRAVWRGLLAGDAEQQLGASSQGVAALEALLRLPLSADVELLTSFSSRSGDEPRRPQDAVKTVAEMIEYGPPEGELESLFSAIAEAPFGAEELERYLVALPQDWRRKLHQLHLLLVRAHAASDGVQNRLAELAEGLDDGFLDDREFTLWMLLRDLNPRPLDSEELEDFARRAAVLADPSHLQLLAIARLFAKAGEHRLAAEHYQLLAARQIRHREFLDQLSFFQVLRQEDSAPVLNLSELIDEAAVRLPRERALETTRGILAMAGRADGEAAYRHVFDAFVLAQLAKLLPPEQVLSEAAGISPGAQAASRPVAEHEAPKAVELVRIQARAGDEEAALATLKGLLLEEPPPSSEQNEPVTVYFFDDVNRTVQSLASLYGLPQLPPEIRESPSAIQELVFRRERIFPGARAEDAWEGSGKWMERAADALFRWLDEGEVSRERTLEALFVIAYQSECAGRADFARELVTAIAERATADAQLADAAGLTGSETANNAGPAGGEAAGDAAAGDGTALQNLAMLSLHLGIAVPPELAGAILKQGSLSVAQEVQLLQALAERAGAREALNLVRNAEADADKLGLLLALRSLAETAGDDRYQQQLEKRIQAAQAAQAELGLAGD